MALIAMVACGGPPQAKDEAAITYHLQFSAEAGVITEVIFPVPLDAAQDSILALLTASDGGTITPVDMSLGKGLSLKGQGAIAADYFVKAVRGWDAGNGAPDAVLSLHVPDGGANEYFVRVNKGGSAQCAIEFEYTAARDCGPGCGGSRSWKYSGNVGTSIQRISMNYVEEKR